MSWFKKNEQKESHRENEGVETTTYLYKMLEEKDKILNDYMKLVTDMAETERSLRTNNDRLVVQIETMLQLVTVQNERVIKKLQEISSYEDSEIIRQKLEEFIETLEGRIPTNTLVH